MTTQSATVRPYSVFVDVPRFEVGLATVRDFEPYVDKGAAPGQLDAYETGDSRIKTIVACFFASMLMWAGPLLIGVAMVSAESENHDPVRSVWLGSIGMAWIIVAIASTRFISRRQKSYDETTKRLGKHLTPVPISRKQDLRRIQNSLQALQQDHGTAYDEKAQEAVCAVLAQDARRPSQKQLAIAESNANDPSSEAIRIRTLAGKEAWGADVARAEELILALETTAEQKVAARSATVPVTAG